MTEIDLNTLKLNNNTLIPQIGFGTWQSTEEECYKSVLTALKAGYRHIDTAAIYGNEEHVGKAIKASGVPRQELFITTKLWTTSAQDAERGLDESLKKLSLDYVDLYLMHWPIAMNPNGNDSRFPTKPDGTRDIIDPNDWDYVQTYKELQKLLPSGKVKAIGVCNFTQTKLQKLLGDPEITVVPSVLQIELHPLLPQTNLVEYSQSKGIVVEAYSPLGSTGAPVLSNETIIHISNAHNVSPATITLSWSIWRGTVVLPKSVNTKRIQSNLKVIQLSDDEGETISNIYKVVGTKRLVSPNWGVPLFDD